MSLKFFLIIAFSLGVAFWGGRNVEPVLVLEQISLDVERESESGKYFFTYKGKPEYFEPTQPEDSKLLEYIDVDSIPPTLDLNLVEIVPQKGKGEVLEYRKLFLKRHFGLWSLIPAFVAIFLCWTTREPLLSLFGGVVAGGFLLGQYNIIDDILLPSLMTKDAAGVLILYLWLLGGLMGIWTKTGAPKAFAEYMATHFVRGPRSAKLVAWFLGVIFFQGGTVSTVLVGTTVKPLADKEKISHEELSYIVDSTASPIASQLAFNAWPGYVQAFIFVSGVSFLATESQRITFFFKSVPFCFYAIFAVLGTFLISIDRAPFLGKKLKEAIKRARETGKLDDDDAEPLSAKELQMGQVPEGYKPHVLEFFLPLGVLIAIAIGTFVIFGSPDVRWAFAVAVIVATAIASYKGMGMRDIVEGLGQGFKGVVMGSVILIMAITIGGVSKAAGGGIYLVHLLSDDIPFWLVPVLLQVMTIIMAFSTGTSWGTYAVAFPLAMPLAWAVAQSQGLAHPEFFMTICFAAVMDGSVFGDQCSPISDTTVLSAMCTGCDLMDHVKTQIPQASIAAIGASILWTSCVLLFA